MLKNVWEVNLKYSIFPILILPLSKLCPFRKFNPPSFPLSLFLSDNIRCSSSIFDVITRATLIVVRPRNITIMSKKADFQRDFHRVRIPFSTNLPSLPLLLTFPISFIQEEKEIVDTLVEGEDDPFYRNHEKGNGNSAYRYEMNRASYRSLKMGARTRHLT